MTHRRAASYTIRDARARFSGRGRRRACARNPPAAATGSRPARPLPGDLLGPLDDGRGQVHPHRLLHLRQRRGWSAPRTPWAGPARRACPPPRPRAPSAARPPPRPRRWASVRAMRSKRAPRFSVCASRPIRGRRRTAATASPPTTSTRTSRPVFRTYSCTSRLWPSPRMASSAASSDWRRLAHHHPALRPAAEQLHQHRHPAHQPHHRLEVPGAPAPSPWPGRRCRAPTAAAGSASCCATGRWPARCSSPARPSIPNWFTTARP